MDSRAVAAVSLKTEPTPSTVPDYVSAPTRNPQTCGEAAVALYDAQHHALAVDVADLKPAQLIAAEARRIARHQHGAVVQIVGSCTQLSNFPRTENNREVQALSGVPQILLHVAANEFFPHPLLSVVKEISYLSNNPIPRTA